MRKQLSTGCVALLTALLLATSLAQAQGDLKAAKAKYDQLCAGCHGAGGKGDGAAAAALNPKPGDFTDCKEMGKYSDDFLRKIIKEGGQAVKKSPMMPPWGTSLKDPEIQNLVAYIKGFCKK